MRKVSILLAAGILALVCGSALAATDVWLSTSVTGSPRVDTINVAPNANVDLYCFLSSDAPGNTFEMMVGFSKSNAQIYGAGVPTDAASGKLTLVSSRSAIRDSINAAYNVIRTTNSGAYANSAVVLDSSGREVSNSSFSGRPYGFVVREAKNGNLAPSQIMCFSFTLKNNMASGDHQYIVLSNLAGGNSYSTAWKYGTSLSEDSYVLDVVSGPSAPKEEYGTSGKSLKDTIMSNVASKYNWVLWGKVSAKDANGFNIDDGSGVTVHVAYSGNEIANDDIVSVKGSLNMSTIPYPTLTASQVTKR